MNTPPKKSFFRRYLPDFLVVILFASIFILYQNRNLIPSGEDAPNFELELYQALPSHETKRISLAELTAENKPAILTFWAPWCHVCQMESSMLNSLQKNIGEEVNIYTVATDYDSIQSVKKFIDDNHLKVPTLLGNSLMTEDYQIYSYPTTYIISPTGKIQSQMTGYTTQFGIRFRLFINQFF